jgi:hypothetical protein
VASDHLQPAANAQPHEVERADALARDSSWLAVAITAGALAVAAVHLIWPSLNIDSTTLIILAIAVLPWLGRIFRSIELPFVKVEYQELSERLERQAGRLDEVSARVQSVEDRVFEVSGPATPEQVRQLNEALRGFAVYLELLGLTWSGPVPRVAIDPSNPNVWGSYDTGANVIQLRPEGAGDTSLALRQYANGSLWDTVGGYEASWAMVGSGVESGLADYLSCSYRDDSRIGAVASTVTDEVVFEDLADQHTFAELSPTGRRGRYELGRVCGSLFWALRAELGRARADQLAVTAWSTAERIDDFDVAFMERLLALAESQGEGESVRSVLERYEFPWPGAA